MDIVMIGLLLFAILSLIIMVTAMKRKITYMDKKLDGIMEHLGIEEEEL